MAELAQRRALVPGNVLMVQPVAADVDDGDKWDLGLAVRGRDTRESDLFYLKKRSAFQVRCLDKERKKKRTASRFHGRA